MREIIGILMVLSGLGIAYLLRSIGIDLELTTSQVFVNYLPFSIISIVLLVFGAITTLDAWVIFSVFECLGDLDFFD